METTKQADPIVFKYLDIPLSGRGGAVRFFLLSHELEFESNLVELGPAWKAEKARLIESGENPCGTVPVFQAGSHTLIQHVAAMRYIARTNNLLTGDAYGDFVQDAVADEYQQWRNNFVSAAFGSEEGKTAYKESLPGVLALFEALYVKYKVGGTSGGAYLSTSPSGKGLWADAAVFALLSDHMKMGFMVREGLEGYANLKTLYDAYMAQPGVSAWIKSKEA